MIGTVLGTRYNMKHVLAYLVPGSRTLPDTIFIHKYIDDQVVSLPGRLGIRCGYAS
jgi:hypothetical protein